MALNKNALIRYRTIDHCLQNNYRRWTLDDLIHACSEALYEYEGRNIEVSKRTVQLDIQMMRSDKLGYNAPIIVYEKKYYKYEVEGFSITDIPLTEVDMNILMESVQMLKQFKDFSLFSDLNGVIQKLEDKVYSEKSQNSAIIHVEKNEHLKGLEYLDTLYQAILKKIVLRLEYQSFKAKRPSSFLFHAFILKEYNNRWFVVGRKEGVRKIQTLALDRISNIGFDLTEEYIQEHFDADQYYQHTFGVTVLDDRLLEKILLKFDAYNAPYVLTKPIHHSQELVEKDEHGNIVISLLVHHNFEIERLILGFGSSVEVLQPRKLRKRIFRQLQAAYLKYTDEGIL